MVLNQGNWNQRADAFDNSDVFDNRPVSQLHRGTLAVTATNVQRLVRCLHINVFFLNFLLDNIVMLREIMLGGILDKKSKSHPCAVDQEPDRMAGISS